MLQVTYEDVCEPGWVRYDQLYNFPGPYEPRINQRKRFNFFLNHPNAFDFSDMGTGKTLTALWAADYLVSNCGGSAFILAPLSTLYSIWEKSCALIFGNTKYHVALDGSLAKRARTVANSTGCIYISNHECVNSREFRQAIHGSDIHTLVVDECDAFSNCQTDKNKHLREVGFERNVWGLTATPMAESPMGAHGVARAVRQDYHEKMTRFRARTHTRKDMFTWVPKTNAVEEAGKLLQPSIRVERKERMSLPPKRRVVQLGPQVKKIYNTLKREAFYEFSNGKTISPLNEATLINKLLQVVGGSVYTGDGEFITFDPGTRGDALLDELAECKKALVLVPYRSQITLVNYLVRSAGYSSVVINSSVTSKERGRIIDLFQRHINPHVIVADARVLAHGVELTAANKLIWWLPAPSNRFSEQARGRLDRPGQLEAVHIVQLCGTTEEARIYDRHERRQNLQGVLLEALAEGL